MPGKRQKSVTTERGRSQGTKKVRARTKGKGDARHTLWSDGKEVMKRHVRKQAALDLPFLDRLIQRFQEDSRPESLPFRDSEKQEMEKFFSEGLRKKGSQTALYITGMPGLGKTACVMEVIKGLGEPGEDFVFIYINGLKLKTPVEFYSEFMFQLNGSVLRPKMAREYLISLFKGESNGYEQDMQLEYTGKSIILIIDEVDFLYTKDQGVFYNIFDWIHGQFSNLIIACIANTLDFPDKVLPKINSRMGKNILIFKPYSSDEIHKILLERLEGHKVFEELALLMIAKKVANFSSDIRKSLHICRKCIYRFKDRDPRPKYINVSTVNEVLAEEGEKPICQYIRTCALPFKVFFLALLAELRFSNAKTIELNNLYGRFKIYLDTLSLGSVLYGQFRLMVVKCDQMKLVKAYLEPKEIEKLIVLCKGDDIAFALREDSAFKNKSQLQRVFLCK